MNNLCRYDYVYNIQKTETYSFFGEKIISVKQYKSIEMTLILFFFAHCTLAYLEIWNYTINNLANNIGLGLLGIVLLLVPMILVISILCLIFTLNNSEKVQLIPYLPYFKGDQLTSKTSNRFIKEALLILEADQEKSVYKIKRSQFEENVLTKEEIIYLTANEIGDRYKIVEN